MVGGSTGIAIAQYLALLGAVQGCLLHGHAVEAVQHVYDHFAGPGLEQPLLRRMFDGESVLLERRGGGRHVGLGDHDVPRHGSVRVHRRPTTRSYQPKRTAGRAL